jgi:hypothetical protein
VVALAVLAVALAVGLVVLAAVAAAVRVRQFVGSGSSRPTRSRGWKLRAGLLAVGVGLILAGLGTLIYAISLGPRAYFLGISPMFGSVLTSVGFLLMGAAVLWLALVYVEV